MIDFYFNYYTSRYILSENLKVFLRLIAMWLDKEISYDRFLFITTLDEDWNYWWTEYLVDMELGNI